jgi:hypothetical protein
MGAVLDIVSTPEAKLHSTFTSGDDSVDIPNTGTETDIIQINNRGHKGLVAICGDVTCGDTAVIDACGLYMIIPGVEGSFLGQPRRVSIAGDTTGWNRGNPASAGAGFSPLGPLVFAPAGMATPSHTLSFIIVLDMSKCPGIVLTMTDDAVSSVTNLRVYQMP